MMAPPRVPYLVTDLTAQKQIEFVAAAVRKQQFMRVLNEVTSEEINSQNLAGALVRAIGEHFGASRCVLATADADEAHWTVDSEYAHSVPSIAGRHDVRTLGPDSVSTELRAGRVIVVPDVGADPELAGSQDALVAFQMRSLVYVPRPPDGNPGAFLDPVACRASRLDHRGHRPPRAGGRTCLDSPAHGAVR